MQDNVVGTRYGTTSEWTASTLVLRAGEVGYDTTLKQSKQGDGTNVWSALAWDDDNFVLTASNASKWKVVVSTSGVLSTVSV